MQTTPPGFVEALPKEEHELRALLASHNSHSKKMSELATSEKIFIRMQVVYSHDGKIKTGHVSFPSDEIPPEFRQFLNDYATRLTAEKWLIENQIETL